MKLLIRSILWPTDFSELSLAAVDTAQTFSQLFNATLHVIHVAPLLTPDSAIAMETAGDMPDSTIDIRALAQAELSRIVRDYFEPGCEIVAEALVGTPWHEICKYVRRAEIDLVVIATHGRTGLRHVLFGSVAERVVQHAHCPVLVVKNFEPASPF